MIFLDRRQRGPIRSVLLVIIGNAVFSEIALRIFLIFCMKLGDYKGGKVEVTPLDLFCLFSIPIFFIKSNFAHFILG